VNVRKTLLSATFLAAVGLLASQAQAQQDQTQTQAQPQAQEGQPQGQPGQTPPPPPNMGPRAGQQGAAGQPPQPAVETVATHNGWIVQCGDVQVAEGKTAKSCGMTRTGQSDKEQKVGVTLVVKRGMGQDGKVATVMDAWVPIGVYLPTGVAMEIDGTALEGRLSFTRCIPQACNAFGEAGEATLKKFSKGKQITFYVYDRPGNGYPVKFPLPGFNDGLADLDKYLPPAPAAGAAPAPQADPNAAAAPAKTPAAPKKK
jgi:invasion protein IalB